MNFWKKKKTNHHHHHHHRENVSDNISIGREGKRERERDSRLVRDREKRSRRRRRHIPHVPSHWRERKREKIFEFVAQKKRRGFRARNGRKTRTLLPPPPPGFVVEVVDFRAGFFSTSSSENRFGVGARRALFLSLILLNRVFFVNVRSLVLIIGAASFFLSFVHTNNNSLALLLFFCVHNVNPHDF